MSTESCYDVCIIGAGPAGLACLSAIREPYTLEHLTEHQVQRAERSVHLHRQLSVCVVDTAPHWLQAWRFNLDQLRIQHLRSHTMAHPDMFDINALFAYACQHGRDKAELVESGCAEIKNLHGLGQTQVGLWKLPSTQLFEDFCQDRQRNLTHTFVQGSVLDVQHQEGGSDQKYLVRVTLSKSSDAPFTNTSISTRHVILATGTAGRPVVPRGLAECPDICFWNNAHAFPGPRRQGGLGTASTGTAASLPKQSILVVGGGLTAIQAALRTLDDGYTCTLCSRRPVQENHFDIPMEWFDQRTSNRCLSTIYHDCIDSRLESLRQARNGGSVPPMYMKRLQAYMGKGLTCWVGEVEYCNAVDLDEAHGTTAILFKGSVQRFDRIILACGMTPISTAHPLLAKIMLRWPIDIHGGWPLVTQDLRWNEELPARNIFVVGAMAALQIGPDAGNLMGMRRAAMVVANAMGCRSWLRKETLTNAFAVLSFDVDDDSDTESETHSNVDCPTCGSCSDGEDDDSLEVGSIP
jgi:hypothetical protein